MNSLLINLSDNDLDHADVAELLVRDKNSIFSTEIMMILSTRPCDANTPHSQGHKTSVLNYGVSDVFESDIPKTDVAAVLASRIETSLIHFEPRLYDIRVAFENKIGSFYHFIMRANSIDGPVCFRITWDEVISRFSLLE